MNTQIKVELQDVMGSDKSVAAAAWTSSTEYENSRLRTSDDIKRVINYLADNKHSTPFESVVFRFWIRMPIAVDRQFMTHRLQSSNGLSGRYRTMPSEFLEMSDDVKLIATKAGLASIEETYNGLCAQANSWYISSLAALKLSESKQEISNAEYKRIREFIRGALPLHNMTERVSVMNLRVFSNFLKLRNSSHAQPEIQTVACKMLESVKQIEAVSVSVAALERNNWII